MKVLAVSFVNASHVKATVGLMSEFAKRGHEVDVVASSFLEPHIKDLFTNSGLNFIDCGIDDTGETSAKLRSLKEGDTVVALLTSVMSTALHYAQNNHYDVIIYDYFAVPVYYFSRFVKTPLVRHFNGQAYTKTVAEQIFAANSPQYEDAKKYFHGLFKNLESKGLAVDYDTLQEELVLDVPGLNVISFPKEIQGFTEELDDRYAFVGVTGMEAQEDPAIPYEKMRGKKIIYVAFGTVLPAYETDTIQSTYEKIIRAYADEKDICVIMSIGLFLSKDSFANIPDNFYIYNRVLSQTGVLDRADLFITHAGAASINESIYYGCPMIAMPGGSDQFINAGKVESEKIGGQLKRYDFTSEELKELTHSILGSEEIKRNIKKVQADLRSKDGNCVDIVEKYVAKKANQ